MRIKKLFFPVSENFTTRGKKTMGKCMITMGFLGGTVVNNLLGSAGDSRDVGSIPKLGKSPGREYGKPLQYSCLENPTDRGAWQATVHGVTKSQTRLSGGTHVNHTM